MLELLSTRLDKGHMHTGTWALSELNLVSRTLSHEILLDFQF